MHILVCSPSWPTSKTIDFVFVEQLCTAFADLGHRVTVIAPQSLTKCIVRHVPVSKRHYVSKTLKGNIIEIHRPYMVTFGNLGARLKIDTFEHAIRRAFRQIKDKPDVCYGHFWQCIIVLYPLAREAGIPLFGASGEEDISTYVHVTEEYKKRIRSYIGGVISVSTKNQQECFSLNLVDPEKSIVIPNAVDLDLFKLMDKRRCRQKLGLNDDDFIVSFVGQFMPRKGTLRLNEALKKINDRRIKAVFIGSGLEIPDYDGILYKGRLNHDEIPYWLNAADIFVLPTENEGCCNSIIEAMACGLPVVSTNAPFNYDILSDQNSIMVDCHNVDVIARAIISLRDDPLLRQRLGSCAIETAKSLSINNRAERIVGFIKENSNS